MPGQRDTAKLEFLVRFVQMDMDTLRPGDWLNLREDLTRYLVLDEYMWIVNKEDPRWETTPPEVITAVQAETQRLVLSWVDMHTEQQEAYRAFRQYKPDRPDTITTQTGVGIQGTFALQYAIMTECAPGGVARTILAYYGEPQSAFIYALQQHLHKAPTDAIRRCPECETLFVRVRKQVYCSKACLNRSGIRRWRTTPKGKQYEETRSRISYEKKVKGKTSPCTTVQHHRKGAASAKTPREP